MRVLLVGLGRWGRNHLRAWRRLGVDLRVAERRAEELVGIPEPCDADYRRLLPDVDAVDVVTPAPSHAEIVAEALDAGKHVLVEKPFTLMADEGFALAARAREVGCILQVGHVFRFTPEARGLARALAEGLVGTPRYVLAHFMGFKRPRTDGGVAISDAVHFVDLASWLLGRSPRAVTAVQRDYLGRGLDDVAFLSLDYGDVLAQVEAAYFPPEPQRDFDIMGSEGSLRCDFLAPERKLRHFAHAHRRDGSGAWQAEAGECRLLPISGEEPLLAELRAFLEACRAGRPAPDAADGRAGAEAVAIMEAAHRSAQEGRTVEIKLPIPAGGER